MSGRKLYESILTEEYLFKEYVTNQKSCSEISKETNIPICSIVTYLKNHKIEQRSRGLTPNMKFGKLTTIKINGIYKNGSYYWRCLCDCGNYTDVLTAQLKNGRIQSCGCSQRKIGKEHPHWNGCGDISSHRWYNIKQKAIRRNISFDITIEEAWKLFEKQNGKCYLSGINLHFNKTARNYSFGNASLDRIDSSIGYETDNVGWIHKDLNSMKHEFSANELIYYCGLVTNFDGIFHASNYNFITHKAFINAAKLRYKKRNFVFDLTNEQVVQKFNDQGGLCALTGLPLIFPDSKSDFKKFNHTASLDRIDNNLGYSFNNVQFVHKLINKSRKNFTIKKYKELCEIVHLYNSDNNMRTILTR